jgi:hypothetical protein
VIAAAFAAAVATPAREALIEQWLRADRTHTVARLNSAPAAAPAEKRAQPPDLQALAARELSIPGRYQIANPPPPSYEPWWTHLWRWLHDRWQRFWQAAFGRVHVGRQTAANIGDVLLVLLGLLVIFVAVRLLVNLQLARDASRTASGALEEPPSPRALYRDASSAASRGDYGAAALLLFAATVALLERRGDVKDARSATVGDLRRELRARDAALVVGFDAVAAPFVQRAYAERPIDEPQWQRARDAFDRMLSRRHEELEG